jgi:fatty-acyl-CoA synthase
MDGVTQGEIVMRGNSVMKGYYKNPKATQKAFAGGFFHSEDIAVQHPDGMMQIADRMKDISSPAARISRASRSKAQSWPIRP